MLHFICFLLVGLVSSTSAENPGVKIRVTQAGLQYAASEAIEVLSSYIQEKSLPSLRGKSDVKVGKVEWSLTGIEVTSFKKPSSSVTVTPGRGITWSARGASVSLKADWRYKYRLSFIKIRDHGSIDMSASGVDFSLSVSLGMSSSGHPTISATGCHCVIGHIWVKIHGGTSWLYNIFRSNIEKILRKQLQKELCKSAEKAINVNAAKNLAKLKLVEDIDKVKLDYSLVSKPQFKAGYIETSHKGVFHWKYGGFPEVFGEAQPITTQDENKMITVWVTDHLINTLGTVLHNHHVLSYDLTARDLPEKDRDVLSTTCPFGKCIGTLFYQVKELYPNSRMSIRMETTEPPRINIVPDHLTGYFHGVFKYYVQLDNGTEVYLLTTDMTFKAVLAARITGEHKIAGIVKKLVPTIKVTDTKIEGISDAGLTWLFNTISQGFIIPKLNEVGRAGVDIPNADEVHFINSHLRLTKGAVVLSTDAKYQPD